MKENCTEIVFILDESGSMWHLTDDTIGGFNSYLEEQKRNEGEAHITTVLFSTDYKVIHDHVDIKEVSPLTDKQYSPCGCTALLDAIGKTINNVGKRLADTPEEQRPAHVIFVITTDGMENSSKEYSYAQIKAMVEHQQTKYSWEFVFIGAGIDAYAEADQIGIGGIYTMSVQANEEGSKNMFSSVNLVTNAVRSGCTIDSLVNSWKVGDVGGERK